MTEAETAPEGGTRVTPLMLNERWRVASDDWLQWILEARHGKPGIKSSGWRGRSFCTTRKALLRCIGEYCGEVDQAAVAYIETWPEQYPHRSRFEPSARPDEVSGPVEAAAA
ncbi:MAG: hypothetical protein V3T13_07305 [Hyphomicrobium sp.]